VLVISYTVAGIGLADGFFPVHTHRPFNSHTLWLQFRQSVNNNRVEARGSAHPSGGPEVWNVVAWGDVRECRTTESVIEEVREALELGCRTISVERQGAPNK